MEEQYKSHIEKCLMNAENNISKINNDIIALEGLSGIKTRHFYNNLLEIDDARYLEIGTWRGSSVCSAMYGNNADIICIDNWSEFGGTENRDILFANIDKFKGQNRVTFIEKDCFTVDVATLPKFNIYMYDGYHRHEHQYKALTHYYDCMDDLFIYVVDDWDMEFVRTGTNAAIRDLNLQVLYDKEIRMSYVYSLTEDKNSWWNGMYVALLKKTDAVDASKPTPSMM